MASRGEIYSTRTDSEKRTYFFNVKENRRGDLFLNIVESNKREDSENFERHQIMVYEEDIPRFMAELQKAVAIAEKKDELRQKESAPKKYRKKTAPAPAVGGKPKTGNRTVAGDKGRPTATNLQRKKVSLKLKKKRSEEEG